VRVMRLRLCGAMSFERRLAGSLGLERYELWISNGGVGEVAVRWCREPGEALAGGWG